MGGDGWWIQRGGDVSCLLKQEEEKRRQTKRKPFVIFFFVTNWLWGALSQQVTCLNLFPQWTKWVLQHAQVRNFLLQKFTWVCLHSFALFNQLLVMVIIAKIIDTTYCTPQRSYPIKTNPQKLHDGEIIWLYILYMPSFKVHSNDFSTM